MKTLARVSTIDHVQFIKKVTPRALSDLREEITRQPRESEWGDYNPFIFRKLVETGYLRPDFVTEHVQYARTEADRNKGYRAFFYAIVKILQEPLDSKKLFIIQSILEILLQTYLTSGNGIISSEVSTPAIRLAERIARLGAVASASELLDLETSQFSMFRKIRHGIIEDTIEHPSLVTLETLEKIGGLQDVIPIEVVRTAEDLSEYATTASRRIMLRDPLRMILSNLFSAGSETHMAKDRLTDYQLAYRLSFLMEELGLGTLIMALPQMQQFGVRNEYMLDGDGQFDQQLEIALEKHARLTPNWVGTGIDSSGFRTARQFALSEGIVNEGSDGDLTLTEKGKCIIRKLMYLIAEMEIRLEMI